MSKLAINIPSLIHGISQQANELRFGSQGELQENAYPSPVDGLAKRHPLDFVADIGDSTPVVGHPLVHIINRSEDERYAVLFGDAYVRVFGLDGTEYFVVANEGSPVPYSTSYINTAPGRKPIKAFKALTIADYTILLNRDVLPAFTGTISDPDPGTYSAILFVRQGNYKTNYRIDYGDLGANAALSQAQVTTWDGTTASLDVAEVWRVDVTDVFTTGAASITILGQTQPLAILSTDTLAQVATKIRNAVNLMTGVTAISALAVVTITADDPGIDITPTIVTNGHFQEIHRRLSGGTTAELASIKTDDIAQALCDQINQNPATAPQFRATRYGSTIWLVESGGVTMNLEVKASDSTGFNNSIFAFHSAVHDFDLLPLTAPDGFKIKVDGDTSDPADDYYVQFAAEKAGDFGPGRWEESTGFQVQLAMDPLTIPWSLVRREDDAGGSVTGTPFERYFTFNVSPWSERVVGDDITAPPPGFIPVAPAGYIPSASSPTTPLAETLPIADIAFFRNRLVLISGQHVVMSEVNRFFNLFRTTTRTLPDSDPIDILVPHTAVVRLNHAVPMDRRLVLFADRGQFILDGDPTLTPRTVQTSFELAYAALRECEPIALERGVFFPFNRDNFSGIRQLYSSPQVRDKTEVEDVSVAVPQYIPGDALQLMASQLESVLFVLAEGDQTCLWVYKFFYDEGKNRLQSAWSRYPLGADTHVFGGGFVDNTLYLVLSRVSSVDEDSLYPDKYYIEAMNVVSGLVDDLHGRDIGLSPLPPGASGNADYLTHLDQRILAGPGTPYPGVYSSFTDRTTWTVPFTTSFTKTYSAVTQSVDGNEGGDVHPLTRTGEFTVYAQGDLEDANVWLGRDYTMRYRFSSLYMKRQKSDGTQTLVTTGRLQILRGILSFAKSSVFRVEVTPSFRALTTNRFSANLLPSAVTGFLSLLTAKFRFGVRSRNDTVTIDIVNDTPLPSNIQSAEFHVEHSDKGVTNFGS